MKFLDLINEEEYLTPQEQKLLKKAKAVFKALQNGSVTFKHPRRDDEMIVFRYQIHDNLTYRWEITNGQKYIIIVTNNRPGEGLTIETDNQWAEKRIKTDPESVVSYHMRFMVMSSIKKKFFQFNIKIEFDENAIVYASEKPQENTLNEESDERLQKKAEMLYKVLKTGEISLDQCKVSYVLSDEKRIVVSWEPEYRKLGLDPHIQIIPDGIKMKEKTNVCTIIPFAMKFNRIRQKFKNFGIDLIIKDIKPQDLDTFHKREG